MFVFVSTRPSLSLRAIWVLYLHLWAHYVVQVWFVSTSIKAAQWRRWSRHLCVCVWAVLNCGPYWRGVGGRIYSRLTTFDHTSPLAAGHHEHESVWFSSGAHPSLLTRVLGLLMVGTNIDWHWYREVTDPGSGQSQIFTWPSVISLPKLTLHSPSRILMSNFDNSLSRAPLSDIFFEGPHDIWVLIRLSHDINNILWLIIGAKFFKK